MIIYYSSKFAREYKKLPQNVKDQAEKAELLFRQDPFNPQLKTHKLKGILSRYYSFSIDKNYRIIFEFQTAKIIWFLSVRNHSIYK